MGVFLRESKKVLTNDDIVPLPEKVFQFLTIEPKNLKSEPYFPF
jgi:hypothetical protein